MEFDNIQIDFLKRICLPYDSKERLKDLNTFFMFYSEISEKHSSCPEIIYPYYAMTGIDMNNRDFYKIKTKHGQASLSLMNKSIVIENSKDLFSKAVSFLELWKYLEKNNYIKTIENNPNDIKNFVVPLENETYEVGIYLYNKFNDNLWILIKEYVLLEIFPLPKLEKFLKSMNKDVIENQNLKKISKRILNDLNNDSIHKKRIFISHSDLDKERFVKQFARRLQDVRGFDVWIDSKDNLPSDNLIDNIFNDGIKNADVIIIILSNNSVGSLWVKEELNLSILRKIQEKIKIIPIVIEDCEIPLYLKMLVQIRIKSLSEYNEDFVKICNTINSKTQNISDKNSQSTLEITDTNKDRKSFGGNININQNSIGNNNIQIGNANIQELHHNMKKIFRTIVQPDDTCIDDNQAYEVQGKIKQLVDIDIKSGKYSLEDQKKRFSFWWNSFKKHFKITDYHLIKKTDYDVIMEWLIKMVAINKPKMRKNNPIEWRKQVYSSIYAKIAAKGLTKEELYSFAFNKLILKKPIESLKDLTDTNLKKLNQFIDRI